MQKLDYSAELTGAVSFDSYSNYSLGLNLMAIHHISDSLHVGLGLGFQGVNALQTETYNSTIDDGERMYGMSYVLPIFAQVKASPLHFGKWTPFIKLNVGVAVPLAKGNVGGFMFEPALGTDFSINKKVALTLAVGTQWMQTSYDYVGYLYNQRSTIGASALGLQLHAGFIF